MKVFKFYCGQSIYCFAAETKEGAIEKFTEDIGDQFTVCEEIPESDWDEKFIKIYEDNDTRNKPLILSIREIITGSEPQMVFTNDSGLW